MGKASGFMLALTMLAVLPLPAAISTDLVPVIVTPVDMNCTWQATFGSYKNQLVENGNGIFMAYYWMHDPPPWQGYWSLLRTTDGGQTFEVVYTPPLQGSCVPCVETDEEDNIHLISSYLMGGSQPFYYHRFLAEKGYRDPVIFEHEGDCWSEKYSVFLDRESDRLYLFNNQGVLIVFDTVTGERVARRIYAYSKGPRAFIQYPHVFVEDGTIYHAWTTQRWTGGGDYVYYNIHLVVSPDGGVTWQKADGTALNTPFAPDDTGPTDRIVEQIDLDYHTWLNSLVIKDGKAHFCYFSDRGNRHYVYVRIDLESGEIDTRAEPRGETITLKGNGGFFATSPGRPLYLVSTNTTHIKALVSEDNGESWHDLAVGPRMPGHVEYVTGCREITSAGVVGSFTLHNGGNHSAYFFRIPLDGAQPDYPGTRITVRPHLIDMQQGESSVSRITIVSDIPIEGEVRLDARAPPGIDVSFHPPTGKPNLSSTVRLQIDGQTPPGTYDIPVTASGGGCNLNFTFQVEVRLAPPSPDFDLKVSPPALSLQGREHGTTEVTLIPMNGFSDYWSLMVAGLPPGAHSSFNPPWGRDQYSSELTISIGDATPAGTYLLNITGSGGGQKHSCGLELTVAVCEPCLLAGALLLAMMLGPAKPKGPGPPKISRHLAFPHDAPARP